MNKPRIARTPDIPTLVTTTDIARALVLTTSTITRDVAAGRLTPAYRMPRTGAFLFTEAEVARYATSKARPLERTA